MLSHHDLALIAAASYSGPQSVTVALDVCADYLPRRDELVVVCPGTHPDDPLDWLRDLSAWPADIPGLGLMHSGFGEGALALWPDVDAKAPRDGLISYVGHSLGGALAQNLAGLHAVHRPTQPFRFVGFGTPRTAWLNPGFRRLLRRGVEAIEYRNAGDPVVAVPPLRLGYLHGADGPTLEPQIGSTFVERIADHAMGLYASRIE
jgi:hypothetical protein